MLKKERLTDLEESKNNPQSRGFLTVVRALRPYAKTDVRYVPTIDEQIGKLDVIEKHIFENVRDIELGKTSQSCLSCHDVHQSSSEKHADLPETSACHTCHPKGDIELISIKLWGQET